jgi:hypothetical protein
MGDLIIFAIRIGMVLLLYVFLFQVASAILRDLRAPAKTVEPAERALARLVVVDPGGTGLRPGEAIPLQELNSVGRDPTNNILLDDITISGSHALVAFRQRQWWVEDNQSTNGTAVNQHAVSRPTVVASGDIVQFGRVKFRLERAA